MANLTIVVDDELLRKARVRAAERGTSVNAVLRELLGEWTGPADDRQQAIARLLHRSKRAKSARAGRGWTRADLYNRA